MFAASAKFRPALAWFARQIAPSVLATLIAALVIAGYNRAFSGHLQQPRMAALHAAMDKVAGEQPAPAATEADAAARPKPTWTTQVVEIIAPTGDIERSFDKDDGREAAKDQSKLKVADVAPAAVPTPAAPRAVVARPEPRQESRPELREPRAPEPQVVAVDPRGAAPMAPPPGGYLAVQQPAVMPPSQPAPVAAAPTIPVARPPVAAQPPVAYEPPPVITAAKPMVTVPDRPGLRPAYEAPAPAQVQQEAQEQAPPQRPGVLGAIVDTLKPSSLFRSAREFGDKIEAAGNDILPNIRQQ
jgi:hypothetical protein